MNPAIWRKAVADAWAHLLASAVVLLAFSWLFVWLMSLFRMGSWSMLLNLLPKFVEPMVGVPLPLLATPRGQLSVLYVHVVTLLVCAGWALGRGSHSISGEIGRGTMDLILSLPVRRVTVMAAPAVVAAVGSAVLVAAVFAGTALGLLCFELDAPVAMGDFIPGAVNLFAMVFCFTAITTLASSWSRDRWRTIALSGGFFVLSVIVKMVARMWPQGGWLNWLTFLSLFQPQELILMPERGPAVAWQCDAALVGIGLAAYAAAGVIFWRRDIPAAR